VTEVSCAICGTDAQLYCGNCDEPPYGYVLNGEFIPGEVFRSHLPIAQPPDMEIVPVWASPR
jgi:hypothetical protein